MRFAESFGSALQANIDASIYANLYSGLARTRPGPTNDRFDIVWDEALCVVVRAHGQFASAISWESHCN